MFTSYKNLHNEGDAKIIKIQGCYFLPCGKFSWQSWSFACLNLTALLAIRWLTYCHVFPFFHFHICTSANIFSSSYLDPSASYSVILLGSVSPFDFWKVLFPDRRKYFQISNFRLCAWNTQFLLRQVKMQVCEIKYCKTALFNSVFIMLLNITRCYQWFCTFHLITV